VKYIPVIKCQTLLDCNLSPHHHHIPITPPWHQIPTWTHQSTPIPFCSQRPLTPHLRTNRQPPPCNQNRIAPPPPPPSCIQKEISQ